MRNQFTQQAVQAMKYAGSMAKKLKNPYIGTEHLLLGLRHDYTEMSGQILAQYGVQEEKVFTILGAVVAQGDTIVFQGNLIDSPRLKY